MEKHQFSCCFILSDRDVLFYFWREKCTLGMLTEALEIHLLLLQN
jgi:hypothetical protein